MGKFEGNGEKEREEEEKLCRAIKGELSQLITFLPARNGGRKRRDGSLKWCETPRAISGREGGHAARPRHLTSWFTWEPFQDCTQN